VVNALAMVVGSGMVGFGLLAFGPLIFCLPAGGLALALALAVSIRPAHLPAAPTAR